MASTSSENHLFLHVNVEAKNFTVQTLLNMSGIDNEKAEIHKNTTEFVDKATK